MTLEKQPSLDDPYAPLPLEALKTLHTIVYYRRPSYNSRGVHLHASVQRAFTASRPADWHQLVLEWPHLSADGRLAYTRDERGMTEQRVTVTTSGKYLRRHFPGLSDHQIRDIVALEESLGCRIINTLPEMIAAVKQGPRSCMSMPDSSDDLHPYAVYRPEFGWSMAIRMEGGRIDGRALVHAGPGGVRIFVRSYARAANPDGYSETDHALEAWMKTQNILKSDQWCDGSKLARIEHPHGGFVMPYIDGGSPGITPRNNYFIIDADSDTGGGNPDGIYDPAGDDDDETAYCDDCDERSAADEGEYVGSSNPSRWVCGHCAGYYHSAYGRRGEAYLTHEDNVIRVSDVSYDIDYLGANDIVRLADGSSEGYAHLDDCFELDGEYYHMTDGVQTGAGEWLLKKDAVQTRAGEWLAEEDAVQTVAGEWLLPEDAVQTVAGEWLLPEDAIEIDGCYYDPADPAVTPHPLRGWILTSDVQPDLFAEAA